MEVSEAEGHKGARAERCRKSPPGRARKGLCTEGWWGFEDAMISSRVTRSPGGVREPPDGAEPTSDASEAPSGPSQAIHEAQGRRSGEVKSWGSEDAMISGSGWSLVDPSRDPRAPSEGAGPPSGDPGSMFATSEAAIEAEEGGSWSAPPGPPGRRACESLSTEGVQGKCAGYPWPARARVVRNMGRTRPKPVGKRNGLPGGGGQNRGEPGMSPAVLRR